MESRHLIRAACNERGRSALFLPRVPVPPGSNEVGESHRNQPSRQAKAPGAMDIEVGTGVTG